MTAQRIENTHHRLSVEWYPCVTNQIFRLISMCYCTKMMYVYVSVSYTECVELNYYKRQDPEQAKRSAAGAGPSRRRESESHLATQFPFMIIEQINRRDQR